MSVWESESGMSQETKKARLRKERLRQLERERGGEREEKILQVTEGRTKTRGEREREGERGGERRGEREKEQIDWDKREKKRTQTIENFWQTKGDRQTDW